VLSSVEAWQAIQELQDERGECPELTCGAPSLALWVVGYFGIDLSKV